MAERREQLLDHLKTKLEQMDEASLKIAAVCVDVLEARKSVEAVTTTTSPAV